ncbi:MAG: D-arabinono-1,4-lactone oxidase [Pseudolysinimonas sp.]
MNSPAGRTWAGTHTFAAAELVAATSIDQVQDAVRTRSGRVRALGTRHSFNDLADTSGTLISVTGVDPAPTLDEAARTVTVGAGIRYGDLAVWLEQRGWALHNMGSLPHISIGGATATGTHGSGDELGNLSTAVRGIEYVGADGELRTVSLADADFSGRVVHLGAFGIVTRLTLAVEPTFDVRQDVYSGVPWDAVLDDLDGVTGSAYSVSVFARWTDDSVSVIRKTRLGPGDEPDLPEEWRGGSRLLAPMIIDADNWTEQDGTAGPWLQRLPHFRLDATPSVGDEIQTEYFVPREHGAAALHAVRRLAEQIDPHLVITELRTMAADDLWLSGAYDRDTLAIHFTWMPHPDAVAALLPAIESALEPFGARPHWGKWHRFDAARLAGVHPRLDDARELFKRLDPEGVFSNAYLERLSVRRPR